MSKYQLYKDSSIELLGTIPHHWNVTKIKWLFCERNERNRDCKYNESDLLSVSEYYGVAKRKEKIKEDDILSRAESLTENKCVYEGDLVINIMLAWKKGLGSSDYNGIVSGSYCVFRLKNTDHQVRYYHYLFRTDLYAETFRQNSTGIIDSRLRLYPEEFFNLLSIIPPPSEQRAIVSYLDKKIAKINFAIEKKNQLIECLQEEKAALINQAVTKGIEEGVPMKPSGVEWLGDIPAHWEHLKLKNICSVRQGLQIPIEQRHLEKIEGSYEYITIKAINNPTDPREYILNPSQRVICKYDDILVARTGATGEIITGVYGVFHNNFFLVDFDRGKVDKEFLFHFLKNEPIKCWLLLVAGTTTIPDLNHGAFYETIFLLPPIEEQKVIVEFLKSTISKSNIVIEKITKEIELLKEYKQSLIYEVVTGKVRVDITQEVELA